MVILPFCRLPVVANFSTEVFPAEVLERVVFWGGFLLCWRLVFLIPSPLAPPGHMGKRLDQLLLPPSAERGKTEDFCT